MEGADGLWCAPALLCAARRFLRSSVSLPGSTAFRTGCPRPPLSTCRQENVTSSAGYTYNMYPVASYSQSKSSPSKSCRSRAASETKHRGRFAYLPVRSECPSEDVLPRPRGRLLTPRDFALPHAGVMPPSARRMSPHGQKAHSELRHGICCRL